VFTKARQFRWIQSTSLQHISLTFLHTPHKTNFLKWPVPLGFSEQNLFQLFHQYCIQRTPILSSLIWSLYEHWRKAHIMKLTILQFPQPSVTSSLLGPNNFFITTFPTSSTCGLTLMWETTFHNTEKIEPYALIISGSYFIFVVLQITLFLNFHCLFVTFVWLLYKILYVPQPTNIFTQ
jgi:hypothetical protein